MANGAVTTRRKPNRELALEFILENPGSARNSIVEGLGISRSAAAIIVADLIESNRVVERSAVVEPGHRTSVGRPSSTLHPVLPDGLVAGLDFGQRHVAVAVAQLDGSVIGKASDTFDVENDAAGAIECAHRMIETILDPVGQTVVDLWASVASIPGPITKAAGIPESPTVLAGWAGLDPAAELGRRFGHPVSVDNDANLGAWGELKRGAGRQRSEFVYLKASDGIGAGLVIGGEIYRGLTGLAGEIGHIRADADGRLCRCGSTGCIEVVASSGAVRDRLEFARVAGAESAPLHSLTSLLSDKIFSEAGRALGKVIADVCNVVNPSAVIVGGELGEVGAPFISGIRESVDRYAQPGAAAAVEILPATLGRQAELVGAVERALMIGRRNALLGLRGAA